MSHATPPSRRASVPFLAALTLAVALVPARTSLAEQPKRLAARLSDYIQSTGRQHQSLTHNASSWRIKLATAEAQMSAERAVGWIGDTPQASPAAHRSVLVARKSTPQALPSENQDPAARPSPIVVHPPRLQKPAPLSSRRRNHQVAARPPLLVQIAQNTAPPAAPAELNPPDEEIKPLENNNANDPPPAPPSGNAESLGTPERVTIKDTIQPLGALNIDISLSGTLPDPSPGASIVHPETLSYVSGPVPHSFAHGHMLASGHFPHRPLYFEEINLERYGTSFGILQPAVSAVRFYGTIPLMPYKMALRKPNRCYYFHHPFEAGRCAPVWEREMPPFKLTPALWEAGIITALIFTLP